MWHPEKHSASVDKHRCRLVTHSRFWAIYHFSGLASLLGQFLEICFISWYQFSPMCIFLLLFLSCLFVCFASQQLLSSLPPSFTGDLLFFSSNNSVFQSELLFSPPDSARFESLMSWFSLPLGSSGNSWPQSGLISMHEALHPAFYFVEFYH